MINMGSSVETVLRKAVIQAEHVAEDRICGYPDLIPLCFTKINDITVNILYFFQQCLDQERAFFSKMCHTVTRQGIKDDIKENHKI